MSIPRQSLLPALLLALAFAGCGGSTPSSHPAAAAPTATPCPAPPAGSTVYGFESGQSEASYTATEKIFQQNIQQLLHIAGIDNTATGKTKDVHGEVQLGPDLNLTAMKVTANVRALTSDNNLRDERIRGEFLESNRFPDAVFTAGRSTIISGPYTPGQEISFKVAGDLTVHGTTHPVTWTVKAKLAAGTITGSAATRVNFKDFGFDPPAIGSALAVNEGLDLAVTFSATKQACSTL